MKNLCVVILAAGKGTRMVSNRAKVLHSVCGTPMVRLACSAAARLDPQEIFVVVGQDAERVRDSLAGIPVVFVVQSEQLGTGHAVMAAKDRLAERGGDAVVFFGDAPRVRPETLRMLVEHHRRSGAVTTLLTARADNPFGYGRILRASNGEIEAIVEERDATAEQRKISEVNPGFYCFQIPHLVDALGKLGNENAQREYYITDLVGIQRQQGHRVEPLLHPDFEELRGINTRRELAEISKALWRQKNLDLMASGVTVIDPECTYVGLEVAVEKDAILYPMVTLEGDTRVGEAAIIHSGTRISDSIVGPRVEIFESCLIRNTQIGRGSTVGPSAHLKEQTVIGDDCRIGNFVEIKKSVLGNGTKAAHLAYLGDATIGRNVNIGAGTITCNYDGVRKNATIIEDDVFIGTDSQLIAPVTIGRGAYIAAGSCITEDVPPGSLAIARERQVIKNGWVKRRRETKQNR